MARCILHIDLDAFFASVEQALNAELRDKPVIVAREPERRGVVSSASYEARRFGIRSGMPSSQAKRLCPQAIFIQPNLSRYRDASVRFMQILSIFSPHMQPMGLDEAYLDVTGHEEAHGSPRQLAVAIKKRVFEELKITSSVGIGTCKVVAKIASDACKPDGLLEVAPGKEKDFLSPLPAARLPGVGKRTEQTLGDMGASTIGDLASLPVDVVRGCLGKFGALLHHYANGNDDRRVEAPGEPKSISHEVTFARDTLDQRLLEAKLRQMCEAVSADLRSGNRQARAVTLKLRYADFKTITRQATLETPTDNTQNIVATVLQLLDRALSHERKPVRLIGIKTSGLLGREKQLRLFDPEVERDKDLDKAIVQIRRKYGRAAIETGNTTVQHRWIRAPSPLNTAAPFAFAYPLRGFATFAPSDKVRDRSAKALTNHSAHAYNLPLRRQIEHRWLTELFRGTCAWPW